MIASRGPATVDLIFNILVFLLGVAGGYIWRDHNSRARHDRARREQRQVDKLDRSMDTIYRSQGSPRE